MNKTNSFNDKCSNEFMWPLCHEILPIWLPTLNVSANPPLTQLTAPRCVIELMS